ncbi:DUF2306 domain-containing protein [Sphingomonas glaciei]|uniref:DUF2306 domain-containing protein n=1 Tax=Sphingomonas glaciei TaxID=2938948 RepID=A0ABY5MTS8_9SPHN|nr:DUF2306 domain-containing protein [Sphingomonas glaciei]UUR06737.1 DUF2306 domain-containing protein [Sphingomonas glaciei]
MGTTLAVAVFLVLVGIFLSFSLGNIGRHGDEAWLYWLHIAGGSIVLLLGPFQFIASIRNRFRRYHRLAGYCYVAGSAAAFVGFWAIQPTIPDVFFLSQATAITLWMLALIAAVAAARRKRMLTHQHNMTRSFVLAAYFVVVRLVDQYGLVMLEPFSSNEGARLAHSDWLAWVVPLAMVEAYYGRKWDKLLRKRAAP